MDIYGRHRCVPALLVLTAVLLFPTASLEAQRVPDRYPETRRVDVVDHLAGHDVLDPHAWLEDQHSSDVKVWLDAQNAFKDAVVQGLPSLERVEARFLELFDVEEVQRPRYVNGRLYYMKRPQGAQRFRLYVRDGIDGPERVLLHPDEISEDLTVSFDFEGIAGDNQYLIYEVRQGGEDETEIRIRDLETGRDLPDRLPRALYRGFSFDSELEGFYYGVEDKQSPIPIFYHELGTDLSEDTVVFRGARREERPSVREIEGGWLATIGHGWMSTDVYLKERGSAEWRPILEGYDHVFDVAWRDGEIWAQTTYGAPNLRLVRIDPDDPHPSQWEEILPEREDVFDGYTLADGRLFARYLDDASTRIEIYEPDGTYIRDLELPTEPANASLPWGADEGRVFFDFQSFTDPYRIYLYDPDTTERTIFHLDRPPIETAKFVVKEEWYESADGTRVHIFVVHKRGLELNGDNPTLLVGYGGFNAAWLPSFSRKGAPWTQQDGIFWLEQGGGVFAAANIRGGREYGRPWRRGGMRAYKQNVFTDFIGAAEHLIDRGYTRPGRLAIEGASNGGLLVGAAMTQRPDLFQAVLADLPEVDLVGFPNYDQINPSALEEYGDATVPEEFEWIIEWSPVQNVREGVEYPSVFLFTGHMDSRVEPVEGLKFVAALQGATSSSIEDKPILLDFHPRVGHSLGGRPVLDRIRFIASQFAYLNWQLGVEEPEPVSPADER